MELAELEFALGRLGAYHFPTFKLNRGQSVELVMPEGWLADDDTQKLWALLEATAGARQVRITRAGTLAGRRDSWWDSLRGKTVAKAVAEATSLPLETAREVCRRCHVEPEGPIIAAPWTDRRLIDFELAKESADLVVVDYLGLDPLGMRQFTAHIRKALSAHRFAVLALAHPCVPFRGVPAKPWIDEPWADVTVTVSRVG